MLGWPLLVPELAEINVTRSAARESSQGTHLGESLEPPDVRTPADHRGAIRAAAVET